MKIIFMGTPEFACPALKQLLANPEFEVVAVYTKEPQIAGRGHKLTNSPIHNLALEHQLKVITPKTLRNVEVQQEFRNLKADAAVVVAYGLILPTEILHGTKLGCFNIHPSLLPKWRGAAPIQRQIMNGDQETGVAIIKMDEGLDSGDVVSLEKFPLASDVTYQSLAGRLSKVGAELLIKTLLNVKNHNITLTKQNHDLAVYAKKLEKSECEIDWQKSAVEIDRHIRGLSGSLGAYFMHKGEKIKIFACEIVNQESSGSEVGTILNEKFWMQCKIGIIRPTILQRQGKRAMTIEEFLLGFKI